MDLQHPKTTTYCINIGGMVQYDCDTCKRCSHILATITEDSVGNKGKKIEWTKDIEEYFVDLKIIVSEEKLLNYTYWTINFTIDFTIHIYDSDRQLGAVIGQNNKPIDF